MSLINFDAGKSLIVAPAGGAGIVAQAAGTLTSNPQSNLFRRGIKLVIDLTAIAGGAPTLTVTIRGRDKVSGKTYTILASAALGAVATTVLTVYPGIAPTANVAANDILPTTWDVQAVIAGAGTITATIGAALMI